MRVQIDRDIRSLFLNGKLIMLIDSIAFKDSKFLVLMFKRHEIRRIAENLELLSRRSSKIGKDASK